MTRTSWSWRRAAAVSPTRRSRTTRPSLERAAVVAAAAEDSVAAVAEEVAAMAEAVEVDTAVAEMVGTAAAEVRWLTDTML